MSPMRIGSGELGLKLVFLGGNLSFHPKQPPMVEEKRDDRESDPFKTLLRESFT
jgi:hypothetical protein